LDRGPRFLCREDGLWMANAGRWTAKSVLLSTEQVLATAQLVRSDPGRSVDRGARLL